MASDIGVGHREHAEGSSQASKNVVGMARRSHSNHDEADSLVICFGGKSKLVERCSANSVVKLKQFAVKTFSGLRKQLKRDRGLVIAMAFAYQGTEISLDDGDKLPRQCGGTPIVCKAVRTGETDDESIDASASSMEMKRLAIGDKSPKPALRSACKSAMPVSAVSGLVPLKDIGGGGGEKRPHRHRGNVCIRPARPELDAASAPRRLVN